MVEREVAPEVRETFATTFGFCDSKIAVWKGLENALRAIENQSADKRAVVAARAVALVQTMGPPEPEGAERFLDGLQNKAGRKLAKKAFSGFWGALMASPLSVRVYKQVLSSLADSVLPHLSHPVMAVDFCFAAYEKGGYCALLSLRLLFVISTTLNIEVDDFYTKLYGLLSADIFVAKHRAQLFQLTDMFLSSEYLPEAVAASFAKRLARLALSAPAPGAQVCLELILNLVRRNPTLLVLLHRESTTVEPRRLWHRAPAEDRRNLKRDRPIEEPEVDDYVPESVPAPNERQEVPEDELPVLLEVEEEPEHEGPVTVRLPLSNASDGARLETFEANESDPMITGALESSLWELQVMQQHYWKPVADLASLFAGPLHQPLYDIAKVADLGPSSVVEKIRRKRVKDVPLEFRAKATLLPPGLEEAFFGPL